MTVVSRVLAVVDTLLCLFVFFPLAVLYWRGTWGLQDVYLASGDELTSAWASFTIGASTSVITQFVQPMLLCMATSNGGLTYTTLCRLHLYICGLGSLCYWRGVWNLVDLYTGTGWESSLAVYGVWQMLSFVSYTARTNVGLPLSIQLDTDSELLQPNTAFDVKPESPVWFALDVCFSQFVIVSGNVCVWRGVWNVADAFLLPDNPIQSEVVSLLIGLASLGIMFLLQHPTSVLSAKLELKSKTYQLLFEDGLFLFATWANILLWRGGWDMCVRYLRSENPATVEWTTHALSTGSLLALQLLNNVTLNGIDKDGGYSGGSGIYPTKYLRMCIHKQGETQYNRLDEADSDSGVEEDVDKKRALGKSWTSRKIPEDTSNTLEKNALV